MDGTENSAEVDNQYEEEYTPPPAKPLHMIHRSSALYKSKTSLEQRIIDEISTIALSDDNDQNSSIIRSTTYHGSEISGSPLMLTSRAATLNQEKTIERRKRSHVVLNIPPTPQRNFSTSSNVSSGSPYSTPRTCISPRNIQSIVTQTIVKEDEIMISPEASLNSLVVKTVTDQKYGYLTVNQIFEFGLRYGFEEEGFVQMFLCTYKTFISPKLLISTLSSSLMEVMNKLTYGYEKNKCIVRICNLLSKWCVQCYGDFLFDKQIHEDVFTFMGQLSSHLDDTDCNFNSAHEVVCKMCQDVAVVISSTDPPNQSTNQPPSQEVPKPIVSKNAPDPTKLKMENIHPLEFARQLTLMEFEMFAKVNGEELLGLGWTKDSKEWTSPNITKIISWTNTMTNWITTCILKEVKIKDRQKMFKFFLDVAEACYEFKNFNTLFEIMMAMIAHPVYRLKVTKEGLPKKYKDIMIKFENVTSFMGNRKAYREEMKQVAVGATPCLPFVGVSLTDLVFFDQGNANHQLRDQVMYINLSKRSQMSLVVNHLMKAQSLPYHFVQVDYIQKFICWETNTNVVSDESLLDKISKSLE
ncbi:RasGEF [Acrasis kona]|uniref:RasGEF n=1 Tax=Acrasis kona TaxID=1008807 RepID=A0AAW2ZGK3_9EUKA